MATVAVYDRLGKELCDRPDPALDAEYKVFVKLEQTCRKCGRKYRVKDNHMEACFGHTGELVLDAASTARNMTLGLCAGASIGSAVGVLGLFVVKAGTAAVITGPPPLVGLTTAATAAHAAGASSAGTTAAAAGASLGGLTTAAGALAVSGGAASAVSPAGTITVGSALAGGGIGSAIKGAQSCITEVGSRLGSHRWTCCGYHQSEPICDGRLSMHLPLAEEDAPAPAADRGCASGRVCSISSS